MERDHPTLSLSRQCRLLLIGCSSPYCRPRGEISRIPTLMRRFEALFLKCPISGAHQMDRHLRREDVRTGRAAAGPAARRA